MFRCDAVFVRVRVLDDHHRKSAKEVRPRVAIITVS